MSLRHLLIAVGLFLAISPLAQAQQLPIYNHFPLNPYLNNPARAGSSGSNNLYLLHRRQWTNMPDAPLTTSITVDGRLPKSNIGLGATLFSDETHVINNLGGAVTYAYHIPFNEDKTHGLSVGLSAGVLNQRFDFLRAEVVDFNDITILDNSANNTVFDVAAGINYQNKGLNVGVAIPQVFNSKVSYRATGNDSVQFQLVRHYFANASYQFAFGAEKQFSLQPGAAVRAVTAVPVQFEGYLLFDYKTIAWLGAGYRTGDAAGINFTVGVRAKQRFSISYNLQSGSGDNGSALGLSHEVMVGYRFGGNSAAEDRLKALEEGMKSMANENANTNGEIIAQMENMQSQLDALAKQPNNSQELEDLKNQVRKNSDDINSLNNRLNGVDKKMEELANKTVGKTAEDLALINKVVGTVYFDKGSSELNAEALANLSSLRETMRTKKGNFIIYLAASASEEGNPDYNMLLSTRRAAAVKKYLQSNGVQANIILLSYGEENPFTETQATDDDRRKNRRVDIFITGQ